MIKSADRNAMTNPRRASDLVLGGATVSMLAATAALSLAVAGWARWFAGSSQESLAIGVALASFPLVAAGEAFLRLTEGRRAFLPWLAAIIAYGVLTLALLAAFADRWFSAYSRAQVVGGGMVSAVALGAQIGGLLIIASRLAGGRRT